MKKHYILPAGIFLLSLLGIRSLYASNPDNDPELTSIQTEIDRNMKGLRIDKMAPPCYIDFRLTDITALNIKASRGALVYSDNNSYRNGVPTVLVGDYNINNQHLVTSYRDIYNSSNSPIGVALGDNDAVIRTAIWRVLDEKYKAAAERHSNKVSMLGQIELPEEERNIPDFLPMEAAKHISASQPLTYDRKAIEDYVIKASEVFSQYNELIESNIRLYAGSAETRYCNSEGTVCRYTNNLIVLFIYTRSQSKDGQELHQIKNLVFDSFDKLPSLAELQSICHKEAILMQKKLAAGMIKESYVGPVLFEGEAVADLVEKYMVDRTKGILAKRRPITTNDIRQYYSNESGISANELEPMINKKITSRDLTLTSLSGTPEYKGEKLFGYYEVDAEGVKPDKELVLIEDGVLRNMLTTRIPTRLFRESNGHARSSISGSATILHPGVLRLSSKTTASTDEMKKKLIAAAKEEDYDYAYIVRKIENNTPAELIRLNVKDGSEELVRGAMIKDMVLRAFKRVSAVSGQENIYNRIQSDIKSTYIVPSAMLFDEVDIVKDNRIVLKKNYIVDKPQ